MDMHKYIFYQVLLCGMLLTACKKDKLNNGIVPDGSQVINTPASGIRLLNFCNMPLDMRINNIPLTTYGADATRGSQLGQSLFPTGVWKNEANGSPVNIPVTLPDKNGMIHIQLQPRTIIQYPGLPGVRLQIDTVLQNDPLQPHDYYVLADGSIRSVVRNITAPARPDYFNIRILNLGVSKDTLGLNGPVTLTWADGTPVHTKLSNVGTGQLSGSVEVPYGTFAFRLFVGNNGQPDFNKQLAELPMTPIMNTSGNAPQTGITTMVRSFKPGGSYTMVITPAIFGYKLDITTDVTNFYKINAYRVITEQVPSVNAFYARMQGVNAWQARKITFRVDGVAMGSEIDYGNAGEYTSVVKGTHQIQAFDAGGQLLAEKKFELYANDNITAWLTDNEGKPEIVCSNTDMTASAYYPTQPSGSPAPIDYGLDGSLFLVRRYYAWQTRFLNLSNVPYVTFTDGNGQPLGNITEPAINTGAQVNLRPRILPDQNPFVAYMWDPGIRGNPSGADMGAPVGMPAQVRVYASAPDRIPGQLLTDVPPLLSNSFVANPDLYTDGNVRPEVGMYSIALIGKAGKPAGDPAGLRLIKIKHTR